MAVVTQITAVAPRASEQRPAPARRKVQLARCRDGRPAITLVSWLDRFEGCAPGRRDAHAPVGVG